MVIGRDGFSISLIHFSKSYNLELLKRNFENRQDLGKN